MCSALPRQWSPSRVTSSRCGLTFIVVEIRRGLAAARPAGLRGTGRAARAAGDRRVDASSTGEGRGPAWLAFAPAPALADLVPCCVRAGAGRGPGAARDAAGARRERRPRCDAGVVVPAERGGDAPDAGAVAA